MKRLKGLSAIIAIAAALLFTACSHEHGAEPALTARTGAASVTTAASSGTSASVTESEDMAGETTEVPATEESAGAATETTAPDAAEAPAEGDAAAPDNAESAGTTTETAPTVTPEPEPESTPKVDADIAAVSNCATSSHSALKVHLASDAPKAASSRSRRSTASSETEVCLGCVLTKDWRKPGSATKTTGEFDLDLGGATYDLTSLAIPSKDKLPASLTIENGTLVVKDNEKYKWEGLAAKIKLTDGAQFITETEEKEKNNVCVHGDKFRVKGGIYKYAESSETESASSASGSGASGSTKKYGPQETGMHYCLGCIFTGDYMESGVGKTNGFMFDLGGKTYDMSELTPTDPSKCPKTRIYNGTINVKKDDSGWMSLIAKGKLIAYKGYKKGSGVTKGTLIFN